MSRVFFDASPTAPVISGTLRTQLPYHALERVRHFFSFLFTLQMLVDYLLRKGHVAAPFAYASVVVAKASHQVDSGMRSTAAVYEGFAEADPGVIDYSTTAFTRMDAAHFCNLGINAGFVRAVTGLHDAIASGLLYQLERLAANTRQLPQRVNIGPDRIVDRLHYTLAVAMLGAVSGTKVISRANIATYLAEVKAEMAIYRAGLRARGKHGVAAAAQLYIDCYDDGAVPDALFASLSGGAAGDCEGYFPLQWLTPNYVSYG